MLNNGERRDTEILAVSPDSREDLAKMVDRIAKEDQRMPEFELLSDPGHKVIDRYGLLNPNSNRGVPHPATYVIDKKGMVRWKFVEVDYKVRARNEQILQALAEVRRKP